MIILCKEGHHWEGSLKDIEEENYNTGILPFATGKSSTPVDIGEGIKFNCPQRSFSVANDGKILKISGSNRRLGTASDGQFGLEEQIIENVKDNACMQILEIIAKKGLGKLIGV